MASSDYKVDYAEITRVYRLERKDALSEIPSDFYSRAREYIESLESAEKDAVEDHRELLQAARAQIREARKLIGNIWEFRTRKIALMAVSQRKPGASSPRGLATEEKEFLDGMIEAVRRHEDSSLRPGERREPVRPAAEKVSAPKEHTVEKTEKGETTQEAQDAGGGSALALLRFLESVPTFATEFGEFDVRKEEVAYLPEAYAKVLIDRKTAVLIERHGKGLGKD